MDAGSVEQTCDPLNELFDVWALAPAQARSVAGIIGLPVNHAGVKNDVNIGPAMGSIHIFILLHDGMGPFIRHDKQKGVGLQIFDLESEPPAIVGLRLHNYRAADLHGRIHWPPCRPDGRN